MLVFSKSPAGLCGHRAVGDQALGAGRVPGLALGSSGCSLFRGLGFRGLGFRVRILVLNGLLLFESFAEFRSPRGRR